MLYLIGGNQSGFNPAEHASTPGSPVTQITAGALLRMPPEGGVETLAHGFHNPWDFDFGAQGDLFTFDSDDRREFSLPW